MAYTKNFIAETKEAAVEQAQAFIAECDTVEQASLYTTYQDVSGYVAVVRYWGCD